jgi:hypothetical protein
MADTKISAFTDGVTAVATDRLAAARSPFGSTDNRYVTPAYIKDYILGLANTWTLAQIHSGAVLIADGSAATPLFGFSGASTTGVFRVGSTVGVTVAGTQRAEIQGSGFCAGPTGAFGWSSAFANSLDTQLVRDGAANTIGQYNTTNVQTYNLYATRGGSTDYHRGAFKAAKTTLSGVSGATVTATSLIPDGALVIGVTTKVTTGLGAGGGTTGYQIGDGVDADRWGEATTITSGTSTDGTNATSATVTLFTSANDVVITAVGGNFNGTGVIDVCVFYLIAQAD